MQEDDSGFWLVDDVSASQGNGELITNCSFEYNMTRWTLIVYLNATSTTEVDVGSGYQNSGLAYLHGASANAPVYIRQTFTVTQRQNDLINFWLYDSLRSLVVLLELASSN
jgi:hypothetical protein